MTRQRCREARKAILLCRGICINKLNSDEKAEETYRFFCLFLIQFFRLSSIRITELWYGNVSPFEQCTRGDKRLKELLKLVVRNQEDLDGTLTEKQKETLEKFEDCMNEMHSIIAEGIPRS